MNITLEVHLNIEGNNGMSRGQFSINTREFKKDPNFTAAVAAYEWIQQIKHETGFRETEITKVIYDGVNDITELVKKIRPVIVDDLPF